MYRTSLTLLSVLLLSPAILLPLQAQQPRVGYGMALAPGDAAPALWGKDVATGEGRRVDWAGARLNLVNFWATWCEPCKVEMPALQKLQQARGDDGLRVIGVLDEQIPTEQAKKFADAIDVDYAMIVAHKRVSQFWGGIATLPTTFLVDSEGKIIRRYIGATPAQVEVLVRDVGDVLDGRPLQVLPMVAPDAEAVAGG